MDQQILALKDRLVDDKRRLLDSYYDLLSCYDNAYRSKSPVEYRKLVKSTANECFNLLKHEKALFSEKKFMKVLLKYIEVSGKACQGIDEKASSDDLFQFMYQSGLGTTHAEFFVTWANALEKSGLIPAATIVFNRGLETGAVPRQLLEKEKSLFQERVASSTLAQQIKNVRQGIADLPIDVKSKAASNDVAKKTKCLLMYNEAALSDQNGGEISFEEWRAMYMDVSLSDVSSVSASYEVSPQSLPASPKKKLNSTYTKQPKLGKHHENLQSDTFQTPRFF